MRSPIITKPIRPACQPISPRPISSNVANISPKPPIAWSVTPRRAAPGLPGGLAFPLPFGTLYSTNITADKGIGIGNYSDREFLDAVQRGIRKDGARLYPAMPYPSYTFMTDADVLAIKAYLFSLPAAPRQNQRDTLQFPFNQRWSMIFWSWAFNPGTRFAPNTAKSAEWNRGAYIAEALAHCGECHTPRNLGFALDNHRKFSGAVAAGWRAYNITSDKGTGIGAWSDEEIFAYLAKGHAMGRGTASGPMGRGDRSQPQPDGAGGYPRARNLSAQHSRGCLVAPGQDRASGA